MLPLSSVIIFLFFGSKYSINLSTTNCVLELPQVNTSNAI